MGWRNRIVGHGSAPVAELAAQAHPANWRLHPTGQRESLSQVLGSIGFVQTVLVNKRTNRMVDGHLRVELAQEQNEKELPVTYVDLSPAEEEEILAVLDPLAGLAVADPEKLDALIKRVSIPQDSAIRDALDKMLEAAIPKNWGKNTTEDAVDPTQELRTKWGTQVGQLWTIGPHRLLIGDSTDFQLVARLLGDVRPQLCLTDPPYGVGLGYANWEDTPETLRRLIDHFLQIVRKLCEVTLITPGNGNQYKYPQPSWTLCWHVPAAVTRGPWGFVSWQPVLAYGKDPYLKRGKGARPDTWSGNQPAPKLGHPCPKPLELWRWLLERGSPKLRDLVYDPFLGSGTTMVAAEQTRRHCFGMELDEGYAAVILERMSTLGLEPKKETG